MTNIKIHSHEQRNARQSNPYKLSTEDITDDFHMELQAIKFTLIFSMIIVMHSACLYCSPTSQKILHTLYLVGYTLETTLTAQIVSIFSSVYQSLQLSKNKTGEFVKHESSPVATKSKLAICSVKVMVKVTRSFTLMPFVVRMSLVEYACQK